MGADPAIQDKQGRTPLHLAVERRRRRVVRTLMTAKPSIAEIKDNKGHSVLDDTPKTDTSLVAVIKKFLEPTHKPSTESTVTRGRGRFVSRQTRVTESQLNDREAASFRGRGRVLPPRGPFRARGPVRTRGPVRERRGGRVGGRGRRGGRVSAKQPIGWASEVPPDIEVPIVPWDEPSPGDLVDVASEW